jgi:hypothetical protein
VGHVAQALKFLEGGVAAGRDVGIASLGQASCTADKMGQTGVPLVDPVLIDAVTIADQEALPIFD